jgi:hypothetical protein
MKRYELKLELIEFVFGSGDNDFPFFDPSDELIHFFQDACGNMFA